VAEDTFHPEVWGYVRQGVSAHDFTGTYFNPNVTQDDGSGVVYRALWSFDTSSIPDSATITGAEWNNEIFTVVEPVGYDGNWIIRLHWKHDEIGSSIDTGDFGFPDANIWGTKSWASTPARASSYTIDSVDLDCVNVDGDTDVEMRCISGYIDPPGALTWKFKTKWNSGSTWRAYLDITYTVPAGLFNRWNWRLPALPGFSNVIAAVVLPSGELKVMARFYPRTVEA